MGSICSDGMGNTFSTGYYSTTSLNLNSITLTNPDSGTYNAFIAKYDQSGNIVWAKCAGGTGQNNINGICTDPNGNIFVTGYFVGPYIILDSIVLTNPDSAMGNVFLAKYDPTGNLIWAKNLGGYSYSWAYSIASDSFGNAFIVGSFFGDSLTFDHIALYDLTNYGAYVAKYNPMGQVLWAKGAQILNNGSMTTIGTDASGNAIVGGTYDGSSITFDTITLLNSAGTYGAFLTKYDSAGNVIWANGIDGGSFIGNLATDQSGNIYLTGYTNFTFYVSFHGTSSNIGLTNPGNYFFFLVKYDPSGNPIWAKNSDGSYGNQAPIVSINSKDDIYICSNFIDTLILDSVVLIPQIYIANSYANLFVAQLNSAGDLMWAKTTSGTGSNRVFGITSDTVGDIYISGYFDGSSMQFGNGTLLNSGSQGTRTMFLAKLDTSIVNGISPINSTSSITVYPNPSSGSFYFSGVKEGCTIEVYDMMGQITSPNPLQRRGLNSQYNVVDLSGQPAGVYFYRVIDQNNIIQNGKMVKE
jgi:hypothetical protein